MTQTQHGQAGPATPVTTDIRGLFNSQLSDDETFRQALAVAPLYGFPELEGSAITWAGYLGLDLSEGIDLTKPISWSAGLPPTKMAWSSVDFVTRRYPVGEFGIPSVIERKWRAAHAIEFVDQLLQKHVAVARDLIAYLVFSALGTTGNYASGHTSDPGNGTSASYDWIRLVMRAGPSILKDAKKLDRPNVHVCIGDAIWPYLASSDQLRNSVAAGKENEHGTDDAVAAFVASYARVPMANVHRVEGTYKNSSGTVTDFFDSDAVAFTTAAPGIGTSLLKMTSPDGAGDQDGGLIRIRGPEYTQANDSNTYHADVAAGVNLQDNEAGVLYTALSS